MPSRGLFMGTAGVFGALAVGLGAFAAHGLQDRLTPEMLDIFEVGNRYHMYHALAMLALAAGGNALWESAWTGAAALLWACGIVVFSGSLYVLALTGQGWLGAVTPVAGLGFIVGWLCLLPAGWGLRKTSGS